MPSADLRAMLDCHMQRQQARVASWDDYQRLSDSNRERLARRLGQRFRAVLESGVEGRDAE